MSGAPNATGLVVGAHGRHLMAATPSSRWPTARACCHPRGKKSECVVGDRVRWQASGDEGVIEQVEPRRNLLYRQDEWKTKSFAANLDQLLVAGGRRAGVQRVAARARADRRRERRHPGAHRPEQDRPAAGSRPRASASRPTARWASTVHRAGAEGRRRRGARAASTPLLAGRATLVLGPSGTGKSTLINLLVPDARGAGRRDLAGAEHGPPHDDDDAVVLARRRSAAPR